MKTEGKKQEKELDWKSKQKILKKAIIDERKVSSQLKEENAILFQRLQKLEELNSETNDRNIELVKENSELKDELMRKPDSRNQNTSLLANSMNNEKKLTEDLQQASSKIQSLLNEITKLKGDLESLKQISNQYYANIQQRDSEIKLHKDKINELSKIIEDHDNLFKERDSKEIRLAEKIEHSEALIHDLKIELQNRIAEIADKNEKLEGIKKENALLGEKLLDLKNSMLEIGTSKQIYPAKEINKSFNRFVTIRFTKEEGVAFYFEITSLKKREQFDVNDLECHLDPTNNKKLLITFLNQPKKKIVFETDYAEDIFTAFSSYRKQGEELASIIALEEKKREVSTNIGDFVMLNINSDQKEQLN